MIVKCMDFHPGGGASLESKCSRRVEVRGRRDGGETKHHRQVKQTEMKRLQDEKYANFISLRISPPLRSQM